uniref:Uncharacterized protein n=1 Tax=Micrurus carvalhoi TaxID=3147026 RepID=A0A2H6NDX4_9SAUR
MPNRERSETLQIVVRHYEFTLPLMQQLRLVFHKGKYSTNIVCNSKRQQSNDNKQKQHSPKAQVLYKFLPGCSEARQNTFSLLQVGVEERVAFHGIQICNLS